MGSNNMSANVNFIFVGNQETLAVFEQEGNSSSVCHNGALGKQGLYLYLGQRPISLEAIAIVQARNDGTSNECSDSRDGGRNRCQ